jgi:hypothetical protein
LCDGWWCYHGYFTCYQVMVSFSQSIQSVWWNIFAILFRKIFVIQSGGASTEHSKAGVNIQGKVQIIKYIIFYSICFPSKSKVNHSLSSIHANTKLKFKLNRIIVSEVGIYLSFLLFKNLSRSCIVFYYQVSIVSMWRDLLIIVDIAHLCSIFYIPIALENSFCSLFFKIGDW